jgi:hypothetical protein
VFAIPAAVDYHGLGDSAPARRLSFRRVFATAKQRSGQRLSESWALAGRSSIRALRERWLDVAVDWRVAPPWCVACRRPAGASRVARCRSCERQRGSSGARRLAREGAISGSFLDVPRSVSPQSRSEKSGTTGEVDWKKKAKRRPLNPVAGVRGAGGEEGGLATRGIPPRRLRSRRPPVRSGSVSSAPNKSG